MAVDLVGRVLGMGGLILFGLGVERLLNAYMLLGTVAVQTRLLLGFAFAGLGALLISAAAIHRGLRRRPMRHPPGAG